MNSQEPNNRSVETLSLAGQPVYPARHIPNGS